VEPAWQNDGMSEQTFAGKVGVITGGSKGAGLATATLLAQRGMAVGLMARDRAALDSSVDAIGRAGGRAVGLVGDVTSESDAARCVAEVVDSFGRLDLLLNNAGVSGRGRVETVPVATWRATIETNLVGPFLMARAAIPHLRAAGGGWIVAIASGAAKQGYPELSAYSASKFGLLGLQQALAGELRADNVKVSTILPGSIMTEFGGRSRADKEARRAAGDKYLEPEDVAQAVVALLEQSDRAWTQEMNLWPF
jgi:NAD(P)-dependent dehydrogenase (short-subunit alcohol dehydrogenase family)